MQNDNDWPLAGFDPDELRIWQNDCSFRQQMPAQDSFRGCLALAALYKTPQNSIDHGDFCLMKNEQVRWLVLRDRPGLDAVDHQRRTTTQATYSTIAKASLRSGMPRIDCVTEALHSSDFLQTPETSDASTHDVGMCDAAPGKPFAETFDLKLYPNEFAVLNRLNGLMTHFACNALDAGGRPIRPQWFARRRMRDQPFRPQKPVRWFPRCFLAFRREQLHDLTQKMRHDRPPFWISNAFKTALIDSLADALPLHTPGPCTYLPKRNWSADLVEHRFGFTNPGNVLSFVLPRSSPIHIVPGQNLAAGDRWAYGLPSLPGVDWTSGDRSERWWHRYDVCGGTRCFQLLQDAWFWSQIILPQELPDLFLVPSDLIACVAGQFNAVDLYWDASRSTDFDDWELQAMIFPPIPISRWDRMRVCLPGEIDLDASTPSQKSAADRIALAARNRSSTVRPDKRLAS